MDIVNIKTERNKLAANISELVNAFQKMTGCIVESISLQHLETVAENTPVRTDVEVRIAIS